jgi:hypothetical protein
LCVESAITSLGHITEKKTVLKPVFRFKNRC